jgi:hypothetical protein
VTAILLLLVASSAGAGEGATSSADPAQGACAEEEEEEEGLRERLTEREDKRRPARPWCTVLAGHPLTVSGEWNAALSGARPRFLGEREEQPDRLLLESELEVEAFYTLGRKLSFFTQLRLILEEDLLPDTPDEVSDLFVERGEMWLFAGEIAGTPLSFDVGRLSFEDDRRWWWDEDLDAVRVAYETETAEVALAVARELGPSRSDRPFVDPQHEQVLRVLGEASWDWRENHALELFALYSDDRSPTPNPGELVPLDREDESDARLTWVGGRAMGVVDLGHPGLVGYWIDAAWVWGDERLLDLEEFSPSRSEVSSVARTQVRGWAFDGGASWLLPRPWEPRLYAGYALGSGNGAAEEGGTDRSFRQTGVQANEAGFGGVERFPSYGVLLDPELSNLGVLTLGAGISLFRSSSLDLVYHRYRLDEPSASLRDASLEVALDGRHRELGDAIDLVLAVEEWERYEFHVALAGFRAGRAFGADQGTWSIGGFVDFAVNF